jgi:hypothetical protein
MPLARKTVTDEVLVTGWTQLALTVQQVTVQWPTLHSFYIQDGRYSSLLLTESLRQALAVLTHGVHHIPLSHPLGWEQVHSFVNPHTLSVASEPATVTLLITHRSVRRRHLGSVHLTSHIEVLRGDEHAGAADLTYTSFSPKVYRRLRARHADPQQAVAQAPPPTPPLPASTVGRTHERDVVLSATDSPHQWQLRVDVGHRVLFDHPHDHVPGMVLLEAAAQAAQAEADRPVTATEFDTSFYRYVEFDRPCMVTAGPSVPRAT